MANLFRAEVGEAGTASACAIFAKLCRHVSSGERGERRGGGKTHAKGAMFGPVVWCEVLACLVCAASERQSGGEGAEAGGCTWPSAPAPAPPPSLLLCLSDVCGGGGGYVVPSFGERPLMT